MYNFKIKGGEHENDKKHRDQLIRDLIYVCCLPHISDKCRREFINVSISWSFSDRSENNIEQSAKYKGCPYWSGEALKRLEKGVKWDDSGLRHEHIVPRQIFINAIDEHFEKVREEIKSGASIEERANREFETLYDLMYKTMIGCVITKEEADIIDGKKPGTKGDGPFKQAMPDSAYSNNEKPSDKWERFSKITDAWARYRQVKDRISVYKLTWDFTKSKRWETDINNKEKVI